MTYSEPTICLNPDFATTRMLVTRKPCGLQGGTEGQVQGERGGLRTKGYFKTPTRKTPLITVIIVVYNDCSHLEKTILSVLGQSHDNTEFIIIDGRSEDGTVDIIKKYEACVDYWVSEPDKGLYDAMNKGWRLVHKQSNILYLGAGDKILAFPEDLSRLNHHQVLFGRVHVGRSKLFRSRISFVTKFANTIHHQALLVPKILHPDSPFDTRYSIYADFDFNQRLLKEGISFQYADDFLAYAMPGGISESYSSDAYRISLKNHGPFLGAISYFFFVYQKLKISIKRLIFDPFSMAHQKNRDQEIQEY